MLSSAFVRFRSGLMLFNPKSIQTCLEDDIGEGGKFVLKCALINQLIQLQDYTAIQRFPLVFCLCG